MDCNCHLYALSRDTRNNLITSGFDIVYVCIIYAQHAQVLMYCIKPCREGWAGESDHPSAHPFLCPGSHVHVYPAYTSALPCSCPHPDSVLHTDHQKISGRNSKAYQGNGCNMWNGIPKHLHVDIKWKFMKLKIDAIIGMKYNNSLKKKLKFYGTIEKCVVIMVFHICLLFFRKYEKKFPTILWRQSSLWWLKLLLESAMSPTQILKRKWSQSPKVLMLKSWYLLVKFYYFS